MTLRGYPIHFVVPRALAPRTMGAGPAPANAGPRRRAARVAARRSRWARASQGSASAR